MACVESMVLAFHEKIKHLEVRCVVLDCFHMVMFMSINPNETIDDFKAHGKEMVVESFDNLQHGVVWTRYFRAYYCQLGK
jgi:hypothetical protein